MQIKTDTATGDHKGIPFTLKEGVLIVDGVSYSRLKIKAIVEIANLLGIEGFTILDKLPKQRRRSPWDASYLSGIDMGPVTFDDFCDDTTPEEQ